MPNDYSSFGVCVCVCVCVYVLASGADLCTENGAGKVRLHGIRRANQLTIRDDWLLRTARRRGNLQCVHPVTAWYRSWKWNRFAALKICSLSRGTGQARDRERDGGSVCERECVDMNQMDVCVCVLAARAVTPCMCVCKFSSPPPWRRSRGQMKQLSLQMCEVFTFTAFRLHGTRLAHNSRRGSPIHILPPPQPSNQGNLFIIA